MLKLGKMGKQLTENSDRVIVHFCTQVFSYLMNLSQIMEQGCLIYIYFRKRIIILNKIIIIIIIKVFTLYIF